MKIIFEKECLRELYETGKTRNKKSRFQPQVVKRYQSRIEILQNVIQIEELFKIV